MADPDPQAVLHALPQLPPGMSRHEWVAEQLRRLIRQELRPGDRLPTVRGLQRQLGVSGPTVRAGQALLAHEGLVEQRHGSGVYVTARGGNPRIGILSELNLLHGSTGVYFRAVADACRQALAASGAQSRLYIGHYANGEWGAEPTCTDFWEDVQAKRLDGAVVLNVPAGAGWPARMQACAVPLVGSQTAVELEAHPRQMMLDAMTAMRSRGVRRCAFVGWGHLGGNMVFQDVADHVGLEVRPQWIKSDLSPALAGAGWSAFREIWASDSQKPDGLLVLDDVLFADVQLAILELGIAVPEQLRVAAQVNRGNGLQIRIPALILEIDPVHVAQELVRLMMARLAGDPQPRAHTLMYTTRDVLPAAYPPHSQSMEPRPCSEKA